MIHGMKEMLLDSVNHLNLSALVDGETWRKLESGAVETLALFSILFLNVVYLMTFENIRLLYWKLFCYVKQKHGGGSIEQC